MLEDLKPELTKLKLHYLENHLSEVLAKASKAKWDYQTFLTEVVRLEIEEIKRRSVESRLRSSRVNVCKWRPLVEFNWSWPKKIDREAIEALFHLNFLEEPANVVFIGPSSLGKTMIARNLVHQAVLSGHHAVFVEANDLLRELSDLDSARMLHNRLKFYAKPKLLVIDEIGYLSFSQRAGDLLFQLISQRYEKCSTVITTNVNFKDWGTIFPNAACVSALLERLLHRAEIIAIEGTSYRMKEADERKSKNPRNPKKGKDHED